MTLCFHGYIPSLANVDDYQFTYKALSEDKNEIRLLRIHNKKPSSDRIECDIFHVSLDSTPSYNALSYA
jgi:hypothetical protein